MRVMRHWQAVVLALLAAPLTGCLTPPAEPDGPRPGAGAAFGGPTGPDIVQMDVALIERPADDPYLAEGVWQLADEQKLRRDGAIDLEHKGRLAQNGFRVGQISGAPPGELCRLVRSERSCVNPRRLTLHAGKPTPVLLGPPWTHCAFVLHRGDRGEPVELDLARFQLEATPALTEDGRTLLHLTPVVKHGETSLATRPVVDPSGAREWALVAEQPTEAYRQLGWDLEVGPSDYVLVGAPAAPGDSLGGRCFVYTEGAQPLRRLLVLRVGRTLPDAPRDDDQALRKSPPLALQAAATCARASSP
jgi:hypothetical protein